MGCREAEVAHCHRLMPVRPAGRYPARRPGGYLAGWQGSILMPEEPSGTGMGRGLWPSRSRSPHYCADFGSKLA
jgi:hypothetical protein